MRVFVGALLLSSLLFVVAYWIDDEPRWVTSAPLLVVAGLVAAEWLVKRAGVSAETPGPTSERTAISTTRDEQTMLWVGAIAGVVVVTGGLGLVRAAFPPMLLGIPQGVAPWWAVTVLGAFTALLGGFLVQSAVAAGRRWIAKSRLGLAGVAGVVIVPLVAWLSIAPSHGRYWGTTGVVAIGFGFLALLIGVLKWLSRSQPRWEVTHKLGFGARTPWLGLLVVTWVVASLLNTEGGYHDARVGTDLGPSPPRYSTLSAAFETWLLAQDRCPLRASDDPLPMVLVAAPGGGIRAAYWTAASLDRLFGSQMGECAARRLFAISGVSGGSVGATTWVTALATGTRGRDVVEEMSKDHALSVATAGLLLRDILQPLTGITTGWRDRAALLEDGWRESAGLYGSAEIPLKWSDVGEGLPWVPLLVLNGSSVTDGCRVLLSNIGGLPASPGSDCGAAPVGRRPAGPVSSSIDPFPGLYERAAKESSECDGMVTGMRALTAALLSARFPVISPSGALIRCASDAPSSGSVNETLTRHAVTYSVDGGYYENSSLFTLLQIWAAIEPMVREHNESLDGNDQSIAPWIVVVDNHYRSDAEAAEPQRPLELVAPLSARGNNRILGQSALEQMAASALGTQADRCRLKPVEVDVRTKTKGEGCLVVIVPTREPSVAAPLGWVLSGTSRSDLDRQLKAQLPPDRPPSNPSLIEFLRQLAGAI